MATQCIASSKALRPAAGADAAARISSSKSVFRAPQQQQRGASVVRFADAGPTDKDMANIGLDDIFKVAADAESFAQAAWLPGSYKPEWLDGSIPGDFGFDPLGLGKSSTNLARFREAELIHARWSMLGVAGMLAVEALGYGNWLEAPLSALNGGSATYFGNEVPLSLGTLAAVEFVGMAFVESQRGAAEGEKRLYPGGGFDPLGFSKDPEKLEELKLKEIKNGRLAMMAALGFFVQASVTGTTPLANLSAHLASPWTINVSQYLPF